MIDFVPKLTEIFIINSLCGIELFGLTHDSTEAAFSIWYSLMNPQFLTEKGRRRFVEGLPLCAARRVLFEDPALACTRRTVLALKSPTRFAGAPYLIASRTYNVGRSRITLGEMVAEMQIPELGFPISLHGLPAENRSSLPSEQSRPRSKARPKRPHRCC